MGWKCYHCGMMFEALWRKSAARKISEGTILVCVVSAFATHAYAGTAVEQLLQHGDDQMRAGHYSNARQYYLSALAYDRDSVKVQLKVAQAEAKIGDLDAAIKRARLVTQIEPKNVDGHKELGRYLEANRDPKAAELQYERAIELSDDPSDVISLEAKAVRLLIDNDDLERADRLSLWCLKGNKKIAECHFLRGLVLAQSEKDARMQEGLKEFKQTLTLDPSRNSAHYQTALIYQKLGAKDAARQEFEFFIKGKPPKTELEDAKDRQARL